MRNTLGFLCGLVLALAASPSQADNSRIRYMLHGNMSWELPTEEYLQFVEKIKPDILIMGVFDQRLYATAVPPKDFKGKAAPPVAELLARWKEVIARLHRSDIRLVGQMELGVVTDRPTDREEGTGWFGYYDKHWDEKLLGPRPTKTAAELLEEPDWDGPAASKDLLARCGCRVNEKALHGCINKPTWRVTQKAMVQAAIAIGVDGFITNRNYVNHCACADCQRKLRLFLASRNRPADLRERLGIEALDRQELCMVGFHRIHDAAPTPLTLEKLRFARATVKEFFDEVYVETGRKQNPDLVLSQWNHLGIFDELHLDRGHLPPSTRTSLAHALADERWGLPLESWGRNESLIWYCNWGTTQNTILEKEYTGDTVLYGKLLRSLARGTPYTVNKYDFYRPRNMIAEAAALGYVRAAISTPWQTEEDREVITRYFSFLEKHEDLYDQDSASLSDVAIVYPITAINRGDASALEYVEAVGRTLIRNHVLFDIIPDDLLPFCESLTYPAIVVPSPEYLSDEAQVVLEQYIDEHHGKVLWTPVTQADRDRPGAAVKPLPLPRKKPEIVTDTFPNARTDREGFFKALTKLTGAKDFSTFDAPWTVQVHCYAHEDRLVLHFVNYNHNEKATGKSVAAREAPIAAEGVSVRLRLPEDFKPGPIYFHTPDGPSQELRGEVKNGFLEFKTPGFLVYGVCSIEAR